MSKAKNETSTALNARVFWCLGLYASGSTWLFNVVRQICLARQAGVVIPHFFSEAVDIHALLKPAGFHIVKSHEISNVADVNRLLELVNKCIVTMRDPRDAVCSLMSYHNYEFQRALDQVHLVAQLCGHLATDRRTLLLTYEHRFFDDAMTIEKVASHIGIDLRANDRDKIFALNQRAAVENHIARLDRLPGALRESQSGDWLDPETHWHTHHSGRTGEIGKWKTMLNEEQIAEIQSKLAKCFHFRS